MTIRRILGSFRAECRILRVPQMADWTMVASRSGDGRGSGLAIWMTGVTSLTAESKAPEMVMSGTITNESWDR